MGFAKIKPVPEECAMNAVLYCRYSDDKQKENSIDFQLYAAREYCKQKGFTIINEYLERALTATNDNRPVFQRMIKDAQKQQFAFIIVYRFDRFARNKYDSAIYKKELQDVGVRVLSVEESVGTGDESIIIESMYEAMAENFSRRLSRVVIASMRETARKGLTTNVAPYGYKSVDHRLVIDEEAAKNIRLCFEWYLKGKTKKEIADGLNAAGARTAKGNLFSIESVTRILNKREYIGENNYCDISRECPRIIDNKTFYDVQDLLEKNKKSYGKKRDKAYFALSGKMFCGECGAAMVGDEGTSKNGKRFFYYTCGNRKKKHSCKKKSEKKDFIEWYVCEQTKNILLTKKRIKEIAKRAVELEEKEAGIEELHRLEKELNSVEREFAKLADKLILTDSPSIIKVINEKAAVLEQRKAALEKDIAALKLRAELRFSVADVELFLNTFRVGDLLDEDFRRRMINTLINVVYIWDDRVCIYYNVRGVESVSYFDAVSDLDQLTESSDNLSSGSPYIKLSEQAYFVCNRGVFGIVLSRG